MIISNDFAFSLITAIQVGMEPPERVTGIYPQAIVKVDKDGQPFFCVLLHKDDSQNLDNTPVALYDDFLEGFQELCSKHQIVRLAGHDTFAKSKDIGNDLVKYEFYVSPDDLHRLMMEENEIYRGYTSGASVANLAHPNALNRKQDVICLFPVLSLDEDTLLIRNAGCNVSETLSTQLTDLAKEYLPEVCGTLSIYGHYCSEVLTRLGLKEPNILNQAALRCCGFSSEMSQQYAGVLDGLAEIHLDRVNRPFLKDMDDLSKAIYARTSAVTPSELESLYSFEVPIMDYLQQIIVVLQEEYDSEFTPAYKKNDLTKAIKNMSDIVQKVEKKLQNDLAEQEQQAQKSDDSDLDGSASNSP